MALPAVQASRFAGVASTREVGLESGKMIGRFDVLGHFPNDFFGECAGVSGDAYQHGRLCIAYHIGEGD